MDMETLCITAGGNMFSMKLERQYCKETFENLILQLLGFDYEDADTPAEEHVDCESS